MKFKINKKEPALSKIESAGSYINILIF